MEDRILKELKGGPLYFKELVDRIGKREGIIKTLYALEKKGAISSELVEQEDIIEGGIRVFRQVRRWKLTTQRNGIKTSK